jgi:hypothetical protein
MNARDCRHDEQDVISPEAAALRKDSGSGAAPRAATPPTRYGRPMPEKIRRVDYFYFWMEDRAGEGAKLLGKLKQARVNILSLNAFPGGGGKWQLTVVPEKPETFAADAGSVGAHHSGSKECFLVQGDDHVGAAHEILSRLAEAKISVVASNGCSAGGGMFGMVIFVKPGDIPAASKALGV